MRKQAAGALLTLLLVSVFAKTAIVCPAGASTESYSFAVEWNGVLYLVAVESNSTVSDFGFIQAAKSLFFNVTGAAGVIGFCNVTIPKSLMWGGSWTVLIDDALTDFIVEENVTHTTLSFTYVHSSHRIQIIASSVIGPTSIYIRADGSVDPTTAPIYREGDHYTLIGNVVSDLDGIIIEKDNVTIDGSGYTIQGTGYYYTGITISYRNNVTIENARITNFNTGILVSGWNATNNNLLNNSFRDNNIGLALVESSISNRIVGNTFNNDSLIVDYSHGNVVSDNFVNGKPLVYLEDASDLAIEDAGTAVLVNCYGITLENLNFSSADVGIELWNTNSTRISGNILTANWGYGILLAGASSNNSVSVNNISKSWGGIALVESSSNNNISSNNVTGNKYGIMFQDSSHNRIFHNNFVSNTFQSFSQENPANIWDASYPSGGNYWSDYVDADMFSGPYQNETGSDGIWDSPYVIDEHNRDNYPLVNPYTLYTTPTVVEWNKTYGTINDDWAFCLLQTSDGGFVMAGPWNYSNYPIGLGFVKTYPNGNLQWTRNFEVGSASLSERCALFETEEGALVFGSSINLTGNLDIWLVKIDEEGQPIWNHTYGGAGDEVFMSAVQTDDGFLLIAWNYTVGGETWLVKTDAQGNVEWEKTYEDWIGSCGVKTVDDGFALIGVAFQSNSSDISILLLKMDAGGNVLWNQTLLHYQTPTSWATVPHLLQVVDGGFVLVGTQSENGDSNILLVKTDEGGNIEWNKTYNNNGWEIGLSITEVIGGFAVLGYTNSSTARGLSDVWLVRTDLSGNVLWDSTYGGEGADFGYSIITTNDRELAFAGGTNSSGYGGIDFWLVKLSPEIQDDEPPVIKNVRHEPLYPMENDTIYFYADVTDNVAVASVQLNYTLDGGATWSLQDMTLMGGNTYSTSMGPLNQFQIMGFYVIVYDTSGNKAYGSEIVPPLPEPPKVAPIVVSDESPNPLPNGDDVSYNVTDGGTEIYVNVTELGIYDPDLWYNISYSIDGGLTWISQHMIQVSDYVWKYWINATTNILFKIVAGDGTVESRVYWIIVGPWKYPIYLYFSEGEQYFPVKGLDFDGDSDISNNWISYQDDWIQFKEQLMNNDIDGDGIPDVWSYSNMNPKSLDDGCLVIQYWIYYSFNRYPIIGEVIRGDHEHDFESIFLWIDVATGNIKKVALSQHSWVNHYTFSSPPKRLNIAVEEGGHGMVLLSDTDNDELPEDYDDIPGYDVWQPEGGGTVIRGKWTNQSIMASVYPWVIFDTRISPSQLHLFGDSSILTTGLSLRAISPLLPSVVDDIPEYYGGLTDLLGSTTVLKTSFGATIPLLDGKMLVFQVTAPWYRQEFQNPSKMWNKVSCIVYTSKVFVYHAIPFIGGGILNYFIEASFKGLILASVAESLTKGIIAVYFDPVIGSVSDDQGRVLGYVDGEIVSDIPGSFVFATRSMTNGLYDLFFIATNSTSSYTYQVEGGGLGTYNMTVSLTDDDGQELNFRAIEIPVGKGSVHRYMINWTLLKENDVGVKVWVDQDGDGVFEHEFFSDMELLASEFEEQTADNVAPSITIISPKNETYATTSVPLIFTLSEPTSWVGYSLDGAENVTITGNTTLAGLLEGLHYVIVYANGTAGNMGSSDVVYFTIDVTPPSIENVSQTPPEENVLPDDEVKVNATITDIISGVKKVILNYTYTNNTGTWSSIVNMTNLEGNIWNVTIPAFPYGTSVTYALIAEDNAGNAISSEELGYECQYQVIPEFPSIIILPIFMVATLIAIIICNKKRIGIT